MTDAIKLARAQFEGWLVLNVGSRQAEEALQIVDDLIDAERNAVIAANAALRNGWLSSAVNRDAEKFSFVLSERLLTQWRRS